VLVASVVIGAPVIEEIIYRGFVQGGVRGMLGGRRWAAVIVTALIFSLAHIGAVTPTALVLLVLVGVALGVARERTGSLLAPIVFHALFNAANIALALAGA
jgi:membrane protease YdiL (CAAX protease family)